MNPCKPTARYLQCKCIPTDWRDADEMAALWEVHDVAMTRTPLETETEPSLLDLKAALARRLYHACHFCERSCGIDRAVKRGWCGVGQAAVASEFLHHGEEPMLIPSHTVFFSGCTFACVFCQNYDISQQQTGMFINPTRLAELIEQRAGRNVNWVGGEPTPNLCYILEVLQVLAEDVPQVWNSNMYCSTETMRILDGIMDIYLTDFKYGNDNCAYHLSDVHNYWEVVTRNHLIAHRQGQVLVRHLVMPGHLDCCSLPIIDWIAEHMSEVQVNIMDQYRPDYRAQTYPDLNRRLFPHEYQRVVDYAQHRSLCLIR